MHLCLALGLEMLLRLVLLELPSVWWLSLRGASAAISLRLLLLWRLSLALALLSLMVMWVWSLVNLDVELEASLELLVSAKSSSPSVVLTLASFAAVAAADIDNVVVGRHVVAITMVTSSGFIYSESKKCIYADTRICRNE